MTNNTAKQPLVLITGSSGLIGSRLMKALHRDFRIAGLDVVEPGEAIPGTQWFQCDMTDDESVASAVHCVNTDFGDKIASVIHLAAYYDFSGEPSPLYRQLTVEGTRRLIRELSRFDVEQFVFSSTLLVMKSSDDGHPVNAFSPTEAEWDYPKSKLAAEDVIQKARGDMPAVILRLAGIYDEDCHSPPIAQHIRRIYEKQLESYFFPGDKSSGQAFIHLDDLVACFRRVIECRKELSEYQIFVIGEEDVMNYQELQEELGTMIHGNEWPAIRIPKTAAKAGAWIKDKLASDEEDAPFIKPWMVDLADQNYPVSIKRARDKLGWEPKRSLRHSLPEMIGQLHHDPRQWYKANGLPYPDSVDESQPAESNK